MNNPWELSRTQFFHIHPFDRYLVDQHNRKAKLNQQIESGLLPLPYLGDPRTARVILLAKNASYNPVDEEEADALPLLSDENTKALVFESSYPVFYLDTRFTGTAGYSWWEDVLGEMLNAAAQQAGVEREVIAGRVACLQSHPYRSRDSFDPKEPFPTQAWTDFLVEEAATRPGVVFVILGGERRWRDAVPALAKADVMTLRAVRKPHVTAGNMKPGDFARLVDILAK